MQLKKINSLNALVLIILFFCENTFICMFLLCNEQTKSFFYKVFIFYLFITNHLNVPIVASWESMGSYMICSKYINFTDLSWIYQSFFKYQSIRHMEMFAWTRKRSHNKCIKYYNFLTFLIFCTCFSTQSFFSYIQVSENKYSLKFQNSHHGDSLNIWHTFFQSFYCNLCIALVSLLEPEKALPGCTKHSREHECLKPNSFNVSLHHHGSISKRLYLQSLF